MAKRLAVTIRFNENERQDLRALMEFYNTTDPKKLVQLAYTQFKQATKELNNKIQAAKKTEDSNAKPNGNAGDGGNDAGDTGGGQSVPADTSSSGNGAAVPEQSDAVG